MGKLTEEDFAKIQGLIDAQVFRHVKKEKIFTRQKDGGEICITCADGAQLVDQMTHRILSTLNKERAILNTEGIISNTLKQCQGDDEETMIHKLSVAVTEASIKSIRRLSKSVMFHTLAANGGPLLIPENSPLNTHNARRFLMNQLTNAIAIKGVKNIVLYTHAPCGAAAIASLSIEQQIKLLLEAEDQLLECAPGISFTRYFHIDFTSLPKEIRGRREKETYFVSRDSWYRTH